MCCGIWEELGQSQDVQMRFESEDEWNAAVVQCEQFRKIFIVNYTWYTCTLVGEHGGEGADHGLRILEPTFIVVAWWY